MKTKETSTINLNSEILTWVFFGSKGITDNADLMRAHILCSDILVWTKKSDSISFDEFKERASYKSCLYDIPSEFLSEEYFKSILKFINEFSIKAAGKKYYF